MARVPVRGRVAAAGIATAVALAALFPTLASAAPTSGASSLTLPQQIAAAQARLGALDARAEAVVERFDAAREQLANAQMGYHAAVAATRSATARVQRLRAEVGGFATAAYEDEGAAQLATITDSSPSEFLARSDALEGIARSQQETLAELATARHALAQAQLSQAAALKRAAALLAAISADKQAIQRAVAGAEATLATLRREEAQAEAAARAAAARARAAAQRRAALAAAAAAAAAAQRLAAEQSAYSQASNSFAAAPVSASGPPSGGSGGAPVAVHWAYAELGKPYQWGAAGPDAFDCSGLTQFVWGKAGVYLDHYTGAQWNEGAHVSVPQPGDLVFFYSDLSHVGIWVGNGEFIQAPHTGTDVQVTQFAGYWASQFQGFVRPGG